MKTDTQTFKASDLLARLAAIAPSVSIEILWSHDEGLSDIRKDCDGMDDEDPNDWQAWQSEVRASAIVGGKTVSGSAYLGGTWEKACDNPAKSNPEISGYLPQMIDEALGDLLAVAPELADQITAAKESI